MLAVEEHQVGYTMRSASKIIGCHEKRIYQLVKERRLATYTGLDGRMMVSREELYHYLRNNNN